MPVSKPAYMFSPLSLRLRKVWKRLCICENEATIAYHGSARSSETGRLFVAALHNGWLVDQAQWFTKYGSKPKKGWRRVKKWVAQRRSTPELPIFNVTTNDAGTAVDKGDSTELRAMESCKKQKNRNQLCLFMHSNNVNLKSHSRNYRKPFWILCVRE